MSIFSAFSARSPLLWLLMLALLVCAPVAAQTGATTPPAAAAPAEPPPDALGRSTPRGTVLGFLAAGRKGDYALARHYLNSKAPADDAETLARELFVVLDARLPARLAQVSDAPAGSRANPLAPQEEHVGPVVGPDGPFDVIVERITPPKAQPIWLFSAVTLAGIPAVYEEIDSLHADSRLPRFLTDTRVGSARLYEWLAVLLGLPAFYFMTVLLNRALSTLVALNRKRSFAPAGGRVRNVLPLPLRLLLLSVASRWLFTTLPLSLLIRQSLGNVAAVLGIVGVTWLAILLNGEGERYVTGRIALANFSATVSLVRVGRRIVDMFVVLAGLLATLRLFGVDPTPLLAGLGVGGIAIALAAQKTLENVIAGASLILDQAVRVGDFVRVGTIEGTVDHIGLRSTRIRTLDRSMVSVPNSQIANMTVETVSARDKFWFHPVVGLRYETTTEQMRLVLDAIRDLLTRHPAVDPESVRVRFLRLAASSLDVEIFAYVVSARDWPQFLEIQELLLLRITEIIAAAGTGIAFPSQTMYVEGVNTVTPQLPTPK